MNPCGIDEVLIAGGGGGVDGGGGPTRGGGGGACAGAGDGLGKVKCVTVLLCKEKFNVDVGKWKLKA